MRPLLAALLLALCALAAAQDALVFIRPDRAGPQVPREIDPHPVWVAWGAKSDANGLNRLWEPMTGQSWNVPTPEFGFGIRKGAPFVSAGARWKDRGILETRDRYLGSSPGLLLLHPNSFPVYVTVLAATGDEILRGPASVVIAEAGDWDEVAAIAARCHRTLVLEFPPDDDGLSHLWLFGGSAWPSGIPTSGDIPGLLRSSEVGALLVRPQGFRWTTPVPASERALPWARERAETFGGIRWALGVAMALAFAFAIRGVAYELPTSVGGNLLCGALLGPAAALIVGYGARAGFGPETMAAQIAAMVSLLAFAAWSTHRRFRSASAWCAVAVLTLLASLLSPVSWTIFADDAGFRVGLVLAALTAVVAAVQEPPCRWTWPARISMLVVAIFLASDVPPQDRMATIWGFAAVMVCGEGWMLGRRGWLAMPLAIAVLVGVLEKPTFAWGGLLANAAQIGRPNLYGLIQALVHPLTLGFWSALLLISIFASGYFRHRGHRAFLAHPRLEGLWQLGLVTIPVAVMSPTLAMVPTVALVSAAGATLLATMDG